MHATLIMFAYMAPQPSLPMTSVLAAVAGLFLMFGRTALRLVTRRLRSATSQKARC